MSEIKFNSDSYLRTGLQILKPLLSTLRDITLIIDSKGNILAHNELALQAISKMEKDLTGKNIKDCFPQDLIKNAIPKIKGFLSKKLPHHFEGKYRNRIYTVTIYPLQANYQDHHILAVFAQDITEARRLEKSELRKSLQLEKLLETAKDLSSSLDIIEVLGRIGKQASQLLNSYSAIYLLNETKDKLIPQVVEDPVYKDEIMSAWLDVDNSLTGKSVINKRSMMYNDVINEENAYQIPGTSELDNERIIVVPFLSNDRVLGAMCLNRIGEMFTQEDLALAETFANYATTALNNAQIYNELQHEVLERRKAEEQLEAHREHLRMITKILRHDIINNLGVIKSSLNIFQEDPAKTYLLEEAQLAIAKSIELISRMRELERYLMAQNGLKLVQIHDVVNQVACDFSQLMIKIRGEGQVLADEAINSVVANIFQNAFIHGKAKNLDVKIENKKKYCEIRFSDDGKGIPDNILERIFDENFIYGKTGNTGLGLYIVKTSAERYGGFVYAEKKQAKGLDIVLVLRKIK